MNDPNDSEERQEWPVSRSFSPVPWPLDSRGTPYPSFTHHLPGPHQPPPLGVPYEIPARAAEFRAIRPFRLYNYLGSPGEDLSGRLYTLGRDNLWEANDDLTREYRSLAQRARQFTSVSRIGTHMKCGDRVAKVATASYNCTRMLGSPYYQPPGPDILPSSPRAPNTSPVAGPSTEPAIASNSQLQRRRGSSLSDSKEKKEWFCELCNFGPFFRKAEYDRHVKTSKAHKRQRSYEWDFRCSKCGRSFTRSDAKTRHEKLCDLKGNGHESDGNDN